MERIPVIDLFAGPGGLGEGFSACRVNGDAPFHVALSIEKDPPAHATLELRAFFRQFPQGEAPEDYYRHLRDPRGFPRAELFARWPRDAAEIALCRNGRQPRFGRQVRRSVLMPRRDTQPVRWGL